MNNARKSMIGLVVLGAAFAIPSAFAQNAESAAANDPMQAEGAMQPAQPATPAAPPNQVTWADLDADKDGNLSKTEVATVPELSQVFDSADGNKDGKLSADEYKTFAAANSGGAKPGEGG